MDVVDIFSYAWGGIKLRKLRAALTTLGIVIGIAAIVALLSLGEGFRIVITSQFERGFALDVLTVTAGRGLLANIITGSGSEEYLALNDTYTMNEIAGVRQATATLSKSIGISQGNKTYMVTAVGINFTEYSTIYSTSFQLEDGSMSLNPANDSIILGYRLHDPWKNGTILFNVGDYINLTWTTGSITKPIVKRYTFHVVGVLKEIGGISIFGPSDIQAYIPITTAQKIFETDQVSQIQVQLVSSEQETIDSVTNSIKNIYGDKVTVISPSAMLNTFSSILSTVQLLLAGLAGISLLVAGIGIMNIMIVSVIERTREIGILKSLGMKNKTVMTIFLCEAALIGLVGAAIGIVFGLGLSNFVTNFVFPLISTGTSQPNGQGNRVISNIVPVLTPTVCVGAFFFGIATSVLFALYPAWRASKLKPVEALRYE
ncbi:ABC transporter permease [Candidatus Bathyarchaeota archaeon]|nr:ABC transporter permease [Candidatus Bathyarchaeota archaeon]